MVTLNCLHHGRARARLKVIGRLLREMAPDVSCLQEIPWGLGVLGGPVTLPQGTVERATFERFRAGIRFEWAARKGSLTTWLRIGQERVMVVNTHLIADYDENWALDNHYARVQLAELSQLGAAIRRLPDDEPRIVAGDFNVPASSPQFADFMNGCGLCSAIDRSVHEADGHVGIDNILYRPPSGRRMAGTAELCLQEPVELDDGRWVRPSGHVGVLARLEW